MSKNAITLEISDGKVAFSGMILTKVILDTVSKIMRQEVDAGRNPFCNF